MRLFWNPRRVFLATFVVYNLNAAYLGSADTLPALLLPASLVYHGDVTLERFGFQIRGTPPRHEPYAMQEVGGHIVSNYPVAGSVLAVPIYFAPLIAARAAGLTSDRQRLFALCKILGKLSASLFTALAAAAVFAVVSLWEPGAAPLVAFAFAFGGPAFSIASQAMWQHGPAVFLLAAAILLLAREPLGAGSVAQAGIAAGLALLVRPATATLLLALGAYLLLRGWRRAALFFLFPALLSLAQLAVNVRDFGDPRGGYAMILAENAARQGLGPGTRHSLLTGLAGVLASPSRGLFVFSPYMIFAIAGAAVVWRESARGRPERLLLRCLSVGALAQIVTFASYPAWWGGMGYGPRYLTEAYLPLVLLLVPLWPWLTARARARRAARALVLASAVIFAIGVFGNPHDWYPRYRVDRRHEVLWSWRHGEIVNALRAGSEVGNLFR